VLVGGTLLAFATPAHATIDGPCAGTGFDSPPTTSTPSFKDSKAHAEGEADFKDEAVWHVRSWKDWLSGEGEATDGDMASGVAYVDAFGQTITVASGEGSGSTGQGGPISAYQIAQHAGPVSNQPPAAVIFASGNAQPDQQSQHPASAPCSGEIAIIFDDASPAQTTAGQIGILTMFLGGAGLAGTTLRR
jgi:hypothetical protein